MATDFNPLKNISFLNNNPVPSVDPADLKSVWTMQEELKKDFEKRTPNRAPNQGFGISVSTYSQACSPGADVASIWYRLSMLWMLSESMGSNLPGMHDGKTDDAVFKALAILPLTGLPRGGREGLPFDLDELIRLIQKESEA
jgi:hypothetical protein